MSLNRYFGRFIPLLLFISVIVVIEEEEIYTPPETMTPHTHPNITAAEIHRPDDSAEQRQRQTGQQRPSAQQIPTRQQITTDSDTYPSSEPSG